MSTPALLLELFNYLSSKTDLSPRHLLLRARYHYPQQIPLLADILSFIFLGGVLNTRQVLHLSKGVYLLKKIIINGDLYSSLVIANRLMPFISSKGVSAAAKQDLKKRCSEWTIYRNNSNEEKQKANSLSPSAKEDLTKLMLWVQSSNYFEFLFRLFNQPSRKCQEHIQSFKLQISSLQEHYLTKEEIDIFIGDLTTQCQKLGNRNYREETTRCIYYWLENELKEGLGTSNLIGSVLSVETIFRLIRSSNNLACACLIHVMEINSSMIQTSLIQTFLTIVGQLMLCSTTNTAIHTNLILIPLIFLKIINKQITIDPETASSHFELWKMSMQKRNLPSKLLMCLLEWLHLILGWENNKQVTIGQKLQLFRVELIQLREETQYVGIAKFLQDMQIKKLGEVYQQLQPYHNLIDQSISSLQRSYHPSFGKTKTKNMKFYVSEMSSKGEINSMMESFRSKKSQFQSRKGYPQKQQELHIYSKKHSINHITKSAVTTQNEQIDIILKLVDLINQRPNSQLSNLSSQSQPYFKKQIQDSNIKVPFLPLFSSHSQLDLEKVHKHNFSAEQTSTMSDPYGLKDRNIKETRTLDITFLSIRSNNLKKVLKNRGILFKNTVFQIDYLFDSLHYRRRINIFLTFFVPVASARTSFENNSVKFCSKQIFHFKYPKINEQLKISLDIQLLRLYKVQSSSKFDRFIRPKIKITYQRNEQEEQQMYEIPMQLYNLIQWQEIPDKQLKIFSFQPQISSLWLPISETLAKNKQNVLISTFPSFRTDQKGSILIKLRFLMQVVFARVMIVIGRCRVELINSQSEEVILALLSVVGREEEVNQQ